MFTRGNAWQDFTWLGRCPACSGENSPSRRRPLSKCLTGERLLCHQGVANGDMRWWLQPLVMINLYFGRYWTPDNQRRSEEYGESNPRYTTRRCVFPRPHWLPAAVYYTDTSPYSYPKKGQDLAY